MDEVIAQLLASEGFSSIEEVAFVEPSEIASIEGFDENTAAEIQTRAREHLEKLEAEQDAKRKALGVADDVAAIPGLTTAMLVALGENNVKTVEDLADCATDDLAGWNERKDKETIHHEGILDGFLYRSRNRGPDPRRPGQGRLDRGSRSRARRRDLAR